MSKEKTALQQAIESAENSIANLKEKQNHVSHQNRIQVEFIDFKIQALNDNLKMLKNLLPAEKEQIQEAYKMGAANNNEQMKGFYDIEAFAYQNKTYGQ